jgi:hypothetical protein
MMHIAPKHSICKHIGIGILCILLFNALPAKSADTPNQDSLLYYLAQRATTHKTYSQIESTYIAAANEMASAGFYPEALHFLTSIDSLPDTLMQTTRQSGTISQQSDSIKKTRWNIRLFGDYANNRDTTLALFDDSLTGSSSIFDTNQISGGFSVETTWPLRHIKSNTLSSYLEVTNSKASEKIFWDITNANGHVGLTGSITGFMSLFAPWKDSANGILTAIETGYRDTINAKLSIALPISFSALYLAANRPGSASNLTINFSPYLDYIITNNLNIGCGVTLAHNNFQSPDDTLTKSFGGPRITVSFSKEKGSIIAEASVLAYSNFKPSKLHEMIQSQATIFSSYSFSSAVSIDCNLEYTYETTHFNDSLLIAQDTTIRLDSTTILNSNDTILFTTIPKTVKDILYLNGQSLSLYPQLSLFISDNYTLTAGCDMRAGVYPQRTNSKSGYNLFEPARIEETGYSLIPRIGISFTNEILDASVNAAFRINRPIDTESSLSEKTNSLQFDANVLWKMNSIVSLDCSFNYSKDTGLEAFLSTSFFSISATLLLSF